MSADRPPLVVVDANVLLAATDRSRTHHEAANTFLRLDPRRLAVTPQIIRDYLAVMTRPVEVNGLGLSAVDAQANANAIRAMTTLLGETADTITRLLDLIAAGPVMGRQVHDANVVACALVHGASAIVTDNVHHLSRFDSLIAIEELPGGQ